ncbi:MAG: type I secretion protein [Pseudaminobacter sp.]
MLMDKTTEAIAHFIGLFEIAVEEARLRHDFNKFQAKRDSTPEQPSLLTVTVSTKAPYDFIEMDPGLRYQPLPPDVVWLKPWIETNFHPPHIPVSMPIQSDIVANLPEPAAVHHASSHVVFHIDPPGSIAAFINQKIILSDNDYVGVGGHGLIFSPDMDPGAELAALLYGAAQLSPVGDLDAPGSSAEIGSFILNAASALETFVEQHQEDDDVFVLSQDRIEGSYVNGEVVTELPDLKNYLPDPDEEGTNGTPNTVQSVKGLGAVEAEASVTVEAGSNLMVNSAVLTNNWLVGPVIATVGDHIELNAIVQINVWSDADAISTSVGGWRFDPSETTQAFNIAMFSRIDPGAGTKAAASNDDFPQNWAVTRIDGDLILMNWIEQFSFMMDNDIHVLSSSGVKSMVTTGDNTMLNNVNLMELGLYFDLIIVGGNIYDCNFIYQMNVLLDNDLIGAVNGFQTNGDGALSTSGNLLWNQAGIVNIGGADRFEAMPDHYKEAAANLKAGKNELPSGVFGDDAFAGLGGLRVLYVSGDILDLQYIKQTNILGDADQVALAMNGIEDSFPNAHWDISTGSNALINTAGILDLDATGKTYVGGQQYSDEILIQAELVSPGLNLGGQDPDVLVNEAVAFLGDDFAGPDDDAPAALPTHDAPHVDVMQTMLA